MLHTLAVNKLWLELQSEAGCLLSLRDVWMLEFSSGSGTWAEDLLGVARSLSPSKEGVSPSNLNSIPFHSIPFHKGFTSFSSNTFMYSSTKFRTQLH